ncbi:MAG: DUF885 domain-containing protein [Actinomycetota bacterium]|nr:DUF885 domain-containing protein [Actinomycetota bacterium]
MVESQHTVDQISDRYVADLAAVDPLTATYVGIPGYDDRMTDFSPAGWAQQAALARQVVRDVGAVSIDNDRDRVAAAQLRERLSVELDLYDSGWRNADLNTAGCPMLWLRQIFDLMRNNSDEDWAVIATRMRAIPQALHGYRESLTEAAGAGRIVARRQVLGCTERANRYAGAGTELSFFTARVQRSNRDGAVRRDLDAAARTANDAYVGFAGFLQGELLPQAPEREAVGRERYALASRLSTGTVLDLEETYAWGWAELARIEAEMRATARELTGSDDVEAAIARLDADPARELRGADALRSWLQETSDAALHGLADVHFDIPVPVRTLECKIAPTSGDGIYYTGPSEDFERPGRMWWSLPEGSDVHNTWREKTTVYHEGVPGHHLQVAQTAYRADQLNRFQRLLCWVSGHGEGWALYAERLMQDLGYLDEPGDRMGMLDSQAFRAARVVLDIGMHLELELPAGAGMHEGERWTGEIGLEFLRAHSHMDDALRRDEISRYLGWPGQAPSYKVGERVWLECRQAAQERHGEDFDLKAFHAAALNLGSMGLDQLRGELARI